MFASLLKSVLHNIGVLIVGGIFGFLCARLDLLLGIKTFHLPVATILAYMLLGIGFLLRIWATFAFYQRSMNVIRLVPQRALITTGAYRFSRNPLYLGGNVLIFGGAALLAGSPSGLVLTAVNIVVVNAFMIPREERQLAEQFGPDWTRYSSQVRRWL